ncbi:MAG TPA: ATP-binding protein [Vicinamibacteria bacterium]|nr:ATP-binding protein [Vicinamibacteria bacterium]
MGRPIVTRAVADRVAQGPPLVLAGPPGAGKTTLLLEAAETLAAEGWTPVYLDLMGAASSPERFVDAALAALPAVAFGARLPQATAIRRLAEQGKTSGAAAVEALFALWSSLDEAGGRPVALLLDEVTEIRSLAYFAGLREVDRMLAGALARRRRATLAATSYATLARRLWPAWETLDVPPLTGAELQAVAREARLDAEALARACFGWPRYLHALWDGLEKGEPLETVWTAEMSAGGRLEQAARQTYETLLLRSRGYGMSKAVLGAVADEEGLNLTALVARVGRTPGAVRDYLGWLMGVDAIRSARKRYYYVDGMVRWWVRLHARGTLARPDDIAGAARQVIAGEVAGGPAAGPAPPELTASEPETAAPRVDTLMEID